MTNNADLRNNTMGAAMRASIGQHLATTTVLDHATAWRVAGDILVMCPQLLESPGMRGHLTEDEKNEQSRLANWDAMRYGHSFMVDGVRVDPRRVVVCMPDASGPGPVAAAEQGDALNAAVQPAASDLPVLSPSPSPHFALVAAVNGFRKVILDSRYSVGDHFKLMLEAQDRIFAAAQVAPARLRYSTSAAADVLAERRRQQVGEGWSVESDDKYTHQQLPLAATCYALHNDPTWAPTAWPWADIWWKPTNPRQNCVKAAALLIAEIERIDRALVASSEAGA
ncbi:hypothetical protein [Janthinobacterium sp. PSPC3-1]|uniref:hypothetical protein n=1 Tax=Janthinobacterium sp. PSPC3-1 TaxID=2804653 RepID=UPI003CF90298